MMRKTPPVIAPILKPTAMTLDGIRPEECSVLRFTTDLPRFKFWLDRQVIESRGSDLTNGFKAADGKKYLLILIEKDAPLNTASFFQP